MNVVDRADEANAAATKIVLTRIQSIRTAAGASGGGIPPSDAALLFIIDALGSESSDAAVLDDAAAALCWVLRVNGRYDAYAVQERAVQLGAINSLVALLKSDRTDYTPGEASAHRFHV